MDTVVPLRLPNGRTAEVVGDVDDLTVVKPLQASGGDWEPHVRAVLERLVRPSWVCLDVGANIGAHTLTMAVLASSSRVVAFEASPRIARYLRLNVDRLPQPKAEITAVECALWNSEGSVSLAELVDFAGGTAFVAGQTPQTVDLDGVQVTRPVGDRDAVLTVFVGAVSAIRLDHWARRDGLKRVDLIKLDVEGAETHVLAGAAQTLERFRPILLTEYNPRCAAYFGEPPDAYFRLLGRLYTSVRLIEPDGSLSELPDWETLEARLEQGKGWEDLLCEPSRATRG